MMNVICLSFSVRVSNELGSAHPRAAKYSVIVTVVQSLFIGIFCAILILATKDDFAVIFTDSQAMRKAVADLAHLLGITMLLNSVQPVISGKIYIHRTKFVQMLNTGNPEITTVVRIIGM